MATLQSDRSAPAANRRIRTYVDCVVVGLLVVSFWCAYAFEVRARTDTPPPNMPLAEGRSLFEAKGCIQCHSVWGGDGQPRVGPDLGRSTAWNDIPQFTASLWNHLPAMSAAWRERGITQPTMSPTEMTQLTAYLFYARFLDEPGDVERGREVFEQRLCARCHQVGGRGGTIASRLDAFKDSISPLFLAQALWNHGPETAAKLAELQLAWPHLESDDVANISCFISGGVRGPSSMDWAQVQGGNPASGKALFEGKGCGRCHAVSGVGGTAGPDLGQPRTAQRAGQMAAALWNHGPKMWAKMKQEGIPLPTFTEREMSDLLAYLYFLQYTGESGDVTKGAQVFRARACSQCHSIGEGGPTVGPDLSTSSALQSPADWTAAVWSHVPAMAAKAQQEQIAWPRFEGEEMRDLIAFLRSRRATK